VDWVGINENIQQVKKLGYTREQVLKRLHVIKSNGEVVTGALAFVSLWRALKFYRGLGFVVRTLHLVPILEFFYARFAERSYKKRLCSIDKPSA
jgi:predicted DCC family thiol-disulfide oxidoreductase YuxK